MFLHHHSETHSRFSDDKTKKKKTLSSAFISRGEFFADAEKPDDGKNYLCPNQHKKIFQNRIHNV
jgi:hypothetical protein